MNEFIFTKFPIFTILLFQVSREGNLFHYSMRTNCSNLEENMLIANLLYLLLGIHNTDICIPNYGDWEVIPLVPRTSL